MSLIPYEGVDIGETVQLAEEKKSFLKGGGHAKATGITSGSSTSLKTQIIRSIASEQASFFYLRWYLYPQTIFHQALNQ